MATGPDEQPQHLPEPAEGHVDRDDRGLAIVPARSAAASALTGAVLSVWRYLPDAVDVFREMAARNKEIPCRRSARLRMGTGVSCATVFPIYQVADDVPGYWLYLRSHALVGLLGAYAVTALVAFVLAVGLGLVQRRIERRRAALVGLMPADDDTDDARYLLDAVVMSAPWQVYRRANAVSTDGHVGLAPVRRILGYGAVYAVVNTALYAIGRYLPVGDWTGFAIALVAVTALGGAWTGARDRPRAVAAG